jgi:hypothetical protein
VFPEHRLDRAHDPLLAADLDAIADLERLLDGLRHVHGIAQKRDNPHLSEP